MDWEEHIMAGKKTNNANETQSDRFSRRDFLKTSAAASASAVAFAGGCASLSRRAPGFLHAEHKPQKLRVGLIGCGGRGTGAAMDCVKSSPNVEIVAMGDLFQDRLDQSRDKLKELGDACQVTDDRCFVGFDAYQAVIDSEVDLIVMAPPPGFRPQHLQAAIEAGKHVFMEKPVAVDPVGVRSIIASSELAAEKGLAIVAGTQRRHQPSYVETMKRIHRGAIGEVVAAQCYWNQGALWVKQQKPEWSDME
jgi:predicted dehydrogenase